MVLESLVQPHAHHALGGLHGERRIARDLAREFGCDVEEMAVVRNASEANETMIFGIDLKRGDEVLMAHHDTEITEGDHVILFLTDRRHVEAVEKLFQAGVSFI